MNYAKKILADKITELYAEKERIEKLGAFADQLALAVLFQKINELKKAFFKI